MRHNREGYVFDAIPNGHLMTARDALSVLASANDLVLADGPSPGGV